jgi:opacity protein-like surface antigen
MLRTRCLLFLILAGAAIAARPAGAQTVSSPYRYLDSRQSLNFFGGQFFTDRGELGLGPSSKQAGGLTYSIRLGGPFSAEASALYLPSTRAVFDTALVAGGPFRTVGSTNLDLAVLTGSIRFDLTGPRTYHNLQPFLLFGGGATLDLSRSTAIESEIAPEARFDFGTRFAGQLGAGVEWFASRRVALRFDARDLFWKLKTPKALVGANTANSEWVQNLALSLGLVYHF